MDSGTGIYYDAAPHLDKIPPFDPRSGYHYWVVLAAFKVEPTGWSPAEKVHMDSENLVLIAPPGCYYCEQVYSDRTFRWRCTGRPHH